MVSMIAAAPSSLSMERRLKAEDVGLISESVRRARLVGIWGLG